MKGRAPAFQFYPGDWLSSASILLMSPAQEGAYIRLLCHCWLSEDCGIPDDEEALAELSRLRGQWKKQGQRVREKFESIGGRLFNPRLIEERQKQAEWSRKSSEGGKRSAATRAQANCKGGSRVVEECLQPNVNSSSSSSSSSSKSQNHIAPDGAGGGLFVLENSGPLQSKDPHGKAWFDREHDAWYASYWNRKDRKKSRVQYEIRVRALAKQGKTLEEAAAFLLEQMHADRERFEMTEEWSWRSRLYPERWLKNERWMDEAAPEVMGSTERAMANL
jgi:uncharacterized protein YdaU (DUF1376 family)